MYVIKWSGLQFASVGFQYFQVNMTKTLLFSSTGQCHTIKDDFLSNKILLNILPARNFFFYIIQGFSFLIKCAK